MKILFITREYPPFEVGGIGIHALHLVTNLKKVGATCKVLSFGDANFSSDKISFINPNSSIIKRDKSGIALDSKIPLDIMRYSNIANKLIKKEHFDVIHVEEPFVGGFISPKHNQPKVTTFHTTGFGELKAMLGRSFSSSSMKRAVFYSSLGLFYEAMSIASSEALLVPTLQVKAELNKAYHVSKAKMKIIENGVELPEVRKTQDIPANKQKLNINPNDTLIFSIARLVSRKRLDLLIKAIKLLQNQGHNKYRVIIAGDGSERPNLKALVKKYNLESIIDLPGWISTEHKELLFRSADMFILTSDYEGFPLTTLEAMSYGVPIINSKIKSLSPLRDGIDGLLFPSGDVEALSKCIKDITTNLSLKTQLSASARSFAEKHSWRNIAQETLKFYESLL